MSEDKEQMDIQELAKKASPQEGYKRLVELTAQLPELGGIILDSDEEPQPVVGQLVALACYNGENNYVYLAGALSPQPGTPKEQRMKLRDVIANFPDSSAGQGAIDKANDWGKQGHEVVAGLVLGRKQSDNKPATALYMAPNLTEEEAMFLLQAVAFSE